ncbi:MAG TPA: DUF58 domain-containing protein [Ilumatobacter sp.]|nr:DUF58 domain-containing protein [Ilumatobacter sp.]
MPTRQGWTVAIGAIAAFAIGRVFGIIELFIIGTALLASVVLAVAVVRIGPPNLGVIRWAHPSILTVGDTGRVDLLLHNRSTRRSPRIDLTESVGSNSTAHMTIGPLGRTDEVTAGYRVPANRRGVLRLGPAILQRTDVLGLASNARIGADASELVVAPQTFELAMPSLGSGVLGRHLLALSQRVGPGEFHSLREYVDGDEPRSIHWKASARSDALKVREHEAQGVRRCIIVLDRSAETFPSGLLADDPDAFERAVSAAGSLVLSAQRSGLTTRFVTGGGIDLRGPEVDANCLRVLAPIDIGPGLGDIERDPGEGLGLAIVVTASPSSVAWQSTQALTDPTLTRVGIFTHDVSGGRLGRLHVDARSISAFREGWQRLAGTHALPTELSTSRNTRHHVRGDI